MSAHARHLGPSRIPTRKMLLKSHHVPGGVHWIWPRRFHGFGDGDHPNRGHQSLANEYSDEDRSLHPHGTRRGHSNLRSGKSHHTPGRFCRRLHLGPMAARVVHHRRASNRHDHNERTSPEPTVQTSATYPYQLIRLRQLAGQQRRKEKRRWAGESRKTKQASHPLGRRLDSTQRPRSALLLTLR